MPSHKCEIESHWPQGPTTSYALAASKAAGYMPLQRPDNKVPLVLAVATRGICAVHTMKCEIARVPRLLATHHAGRNEIVTLEQEKATSIAK